jgi:hypothetical protein
MTMKGIPTQNFRIEASIQATMIGSVEVEATCIEEAQWKALKHFRSGDAEWKYNGSNDDTLEIGGIPYGNVKRFLQPYELEAPYVGYTTWRRLPNGEEVTSGFFSPQGVFALIPGTMLKAVTAEERDFYIANGKFDRILPIAQRKQVVVE